MMKIRTGENVREVLCTQFGLSRDYVDNRITTIFLDGKPVDDIDSSYIKDRSTLSLSASLPGLVGATMRRSGFYASFRNTISYKEDNNTRKNADGMIKIKLFNIILKEIGEDLLKKGIYVSYGDIESLLMNKDYNFVENCTNVFLDGKETDCGILKENRLSLYGMICIKMNS